ncbi:GNAT family N-acetyltransferase [Chitinophaga agri]|nr:GNAT family N-acetyltransferase [Chitinophaga agri]
MNVVKAPEQHTSPEPFNYHHIKSDKLLPDDYLSTVMDNIVIKRTASTVPDFQLLITELDADLRRRNGDIMDIYDGHNKLQPLDTAVVIYMNDVPVCCGCFKSYSDDAVEVKRVYVRDEARGKGFSKLLMKELETWATEIGFRKTVLETGSQQQEALGLYTSLGYKRIPNYEPYIGLPDSVCFEKDLL